MHIRRATSFDFPTTATFSVAAFQDDELYRYTNPHIHHYQDSFRRYFLRRQRLRNNSPGYITFVALAEPFQTTNKDAAKERVGDAAQGGRSRGSCEEVAGYAVWYRHGTTEAARSWHTQSWGEWFESILLQAEDSYVSLFRLDRSASPQNRRSLEATGFFGDDTFASLPERWHLQNLCVNPEFQRRGVGAQLVSWGQEQATKEQVPVTLSTSTVAESLYRKVGFKTWSLLDMPGVRMEAPSLIWWPDGVTPVKGPQSAVE
ncbi:MAG: hypothetical protein Q9212_005202 [Teloschistes hypoglaucus]